GAEDNRAHPVRGSDLVDTLDHFGDALGGIDERHRLALKIEFFELGQQAVPEHLRSDAGAIRNEEDGAACRQWMAGSMLVSPPAPHGRGTYGQRRHIADIDPAFSRSM